MRQHDNGSHAAESKPIFSQIAYSLLRLVAPNCGVNTNDGSGRYHGSNITYLRRLGQGKSLKTINEALDSDLLEGLVLLGKQSPDELSANNARLMPEGE